MVKLTDAQILGVYDKVSDALYHTAGSRRYQTHSEAMYGFDHTRNAIYMPEFEGHGFTFITRPKLNFTTSSLRQDRTLSMLDTLDPQSIAFAIRALLDTRLFQSYKVDTKDLSKFFNKMNPFIPVLSNRLLTMNGWPDWMLDVETTDGGFFSESITYPKGHDQLTRNYDIQASFGDVQGSPILILFTMWFRYIHLLTRGLVTAYMEDIEQRRMGFTCSIYRFVMDPSQRSILKWAKATGCYPRHVPLGAYFNYDTNAGHVDGAMNLSMPFTVAGRVEYYDPIILREFNMLVERFCPMIRTYKVAHDRLRMLLNYRCIPYIDVERGTNELQWRYDPNDEVVKELIRSSSSLYKDDGPIDPATGESVNQPLLAQANPTWV